MTEIALIGAAGKMGGRILRALDGDPDYRVRCVETAPAARARLEQTGLQVRELEDALPGARLVVMAVPDSIAGEVAAEVVPQLDSGAIVFCLDPAAPYAGRLPERADVSCFVTHPTHPPLFELLAEETPEARRDFWGGGLARQSLVNALVWGDEAAYADGEELAKRIFKPILRSFRVGLDEMALLEPAMSESVVVTCVKVMRATMDEVIARGVAPQAVRDFMLGHVQIALALTFDELDWQLSGGAEQAAREAMDVLFQPDWKRVLDPDAVRASVERITGGAITA